MSPATRYHIGDHLVGAVRDGNCLCAEDRAQYVVAALAALQPRAKSERNSRTK
jgi:hypothetical protein